MKLLLYAIFLTIISAQLSYSQEYDLNMAKGKDASINENYNLALYYFNKAIENNTNEIEPFIERAHANNMLGNYREGINDYNFVLSKDKYNTRAYFGLGSIYDTWLNDKQVAINYYTKVIDYSLQKGDNDFAGTGYLMRADLKARIYDRKGYLQDLKKGSDLNHSTCRDLLKLELTNEYLKRYNK